MATSDKKPGQGPSLAFSFGEKELIFAREVFGKLSSHSVSIRDLEGWVNGTPPESLPGWYIFSRQNMFLKFVAEKSTH